MKREPKSSPVHLKNLKKALKSKIISAIHLKFSMSQVFIKQIVFDLYLIKVMVLMARSLLINKRKCFFLTLFIEIDEV